MKPKHRMSVGWLLFLSMSVISLISVVSMGSLLLMRDLRHMKGEVQRIRESYLAGEKQRLKHEVNKTLETIEYQHSLAAQRLKENIKSRTDEAVVLAQYLFEQYRDQMDPESLQEMILDALRPIRFNQGRGYFFATRLDGVELLFADRPEMEGKNLLSMRDPNGQYVIRDMIDLVRREGEGYYRYLWSKPNEEGRHFPKIAFIKHFAPLDAFIGTGEYLDTVERDIQVEALKQIGKIRFDDEGYIFVVSYDGVTLMNGVQPELIGKNMWEVTDPHGVKVIQVERRAVDNPQGEFITYHWEKPSTGRISPKISFVRGYAPWQWMVGAGIYADEVETRITTLELESRTQALHKMFIMGIILLLALLGILLISMLLSRRLSREFSLLIRAFQRMEHDDEPVDTDQLLLNETRALGESANTMLAARQQAEDALRESEKRWRSVLVETPQIGIALNRQAEIAFANKRFLDLTGWREEEVMWRNWFDLFIPDDVREQVRAVFDQVMHAQSTVGFSNYENEILTRSGARLNVAWSNVLTRDTLGEVVDVTCLGIDLTERKQAEWALKESEERFRALHNASFGGIAIHDQGLIIECNKGLSELTGYGYDELIGMDGLRMLISDDTRDQVALKIKEGYEKPYEAKGLRKNGEAYPLRLEARNIPYKGKMVRVVEFRDLTESKQAEKDRAELEGQLRQAQKMEAVGRLAGGVAHDFNNMLGVILGHAELAMDKVQPSDPLFSNLEEIRKAGARSADLTRQLLAFARKQTVAPQVLNLNETVEGMLRMLQRFIGEDVDLVWMPGKAVWPIHVDPSQVDQILANLCVNARDAIAGVGKISIQTYNRVCDEVFALEKRGLTAGEYVILSVQDDGCGMDAKILENIFEPFFTTKEAGKGTGLGLATVYGAVKQNHGFIDVSSQPGSGTRFDIYFPRHRDPLPEKPRMAAEQTVERGQETILLVEDEPSILTMTTLMLEGLGYTVVAARGPGEAIQLADDYAGKIHLLLTDVVMPEMNGRDLGHRILASHPELRHLYMSGYTSDVIAHHGVLDEGVSFIQKPFSMKELGSRVRQALTGA